MRALITGGAGFLGSNIADRLLADGHDVAVLDDCSTGRRDALQPHARLRVVEGGVEDRAAVEALCEEFRPTHIIHGAASYKDPDDWRRDVLVNVLGTVHLLEQGKALGVKRFVYLQTALSYGRAKQNPIPVTAPLWPVTSYSISKTDGERYVAMSGLPWVTLRLANIYGPRNYTGPIPTFYKRLKAGQPCTVVRTRRDFLDFDDFMRLMTKVLADGAPTGAFNVSSEKDRTIEELYHLMVRLMGLGDRPPAGVVDPGADDVASLLLDSSRTREAFGWAPEVDLETGLARLVRWFDKHGVGETYTHLRLERR